MAGRHALEAQLSIRPANTRTADYTFVLADAGKAVEGNAAGALNFTVPPNSSVPFALGTIIEVPQIGAGAVTLVAGGGVTITGDTVTPGQGGSLLLRKTGTNAWWSAIVAVRSGTFADNPTPGVARTAVVTTTDQTVSGAKDFTADGGLKYKGQPVARVNEGPLSMLDPRVGCLLDGSDETAKVTTALGLLPAAGGELFLPPGLLTANVSVQRNDVKIRGAGRNSVIKAASGSTVMAFGDGGATVRQGLSLASLVIDGAFSNGRSGLKVNKATRVTLVDVDLQNCPYANLWTTGIATEIRGYGCGFFSAGSGGPGTTGWGIKGEADSNGHEFYGCDWKGNVMGAAEYDMSYLVVLQGIMQSNGIGGSQHAAVIFRGGGALVVLAYMEANGGGQADSAQVLLTNSGGTYVGSASIKGHLNGSYNAGVAGVQYAVYCDGVANVTLEPGTILLSHGVAELFISANIASEGVTADRIRRLIPAPALAAGAGAAALSSDLTGGTKRFNGAISFAGGSPHVKVSTTYSVGGNALALSLAAGDILKVTLAASMGGAATTFTGATDGQVFTVHFIQDATGSRSYSWPAACKFAGGVAPSASTTAGWADSVTFWYDGANGNFNEISRSVGMR